jgi:ubiquinol-cytochrome c reductase cytochrome c subunit
VALVVALAAGALASIAADSRTGAQELQPPPPPPSEPPSKFAPADPGAIPPSAAQSEEAALIEQGRALYEDGCSSCHGSEVNGIDGRAPSLRGVGEASADFYLRTGRMPLDDPEDQPRRAESPYSRDEQLAIIAYIGRFGGPGIPDVRPERGDVSEGLRLFTDNCAGCHQVVGQGGITSRAVAPDLQVSEPVDVGEAITVGPYVMPEFAEQLSPSDVDSIAAYIEYTEDPDDVGGWGIGHIGPIPEGMVAWLLAGAALLLTVRLIGERSTG